MAAQRMEAQRMAAAQEDETSSLTLSVHAAGYSIVDQLVLELALFLVCSSDNAACEMASHLADTASSNICGLCRKSTGILPA